MSNAVRTGVVTNMSPIWMISSVSIRSLRTTIPGGGRPLRQIISMGVAALTHSAPCIAAAARPVITPLRPDHSQAAKVFWASEGTTSFGT